jgi:hypothetical protein
MLLSVGAALLGCARLVLAWFIFNVDVERRCAVIYEDRVDLLELSFFPILAFLVVGLLPLGSIAIRLWGPSASLQIIWRQTVIFYGSNARVGLCGALGVLGLGLIGSVEKAAYVLLTVGLAGALDTLLLLSRSTLGICLYSLALMSNYGISWLQERLLLADCDLIGTRTRQSLESRVLAGTAVAAWLLFVLAMLALAGRRVLHPRRPFAQAPRLPYSLEYDALVGSEFCGLTFFYNVYEMRAVRTGAEAHVILSDPEFTFWFFDVRKFPSPKLDTVMTVCYGLATIIYALNIGIFVMVAIGTADPSVRCFSDPSSVLAVLIALAPVLAMFLIGLALLAGLWQWTRVVRRPWSSLARYFWFSIHNNRTFAILATCDFVLYFSTAAATSLLELPAVILFPLVDAFSLYTRRKLNVIFRLCTGVVMSRAIAKHAFDVLVFANLCSNVEDRLSFEHFILYHVGTSLSIVWNLSQLAIFSRKLRDARNPFFNFRLKKGVGFEVDVLFTETVQNDSHQAASRQRHARSVEMRTRSGSSKPDVVAPTML